MSTQLFINAHIATGMPGSTAAETTAIQDILVEDGKFISIAPHLKATLEAQGKDMERGSRRFGRKAGLSTILRHPSAS